MEYTLTPAYGRDYKSAVDCETAFLSGKDFTIAMTGQLCSARDFIGKSVRIRYSGRNKILLLERVFPTGFLRPARKVV